MPAKPLPEPPRARDDTDEVNDALMQMARLCDICSDWNLEYVEIDVPTQYLGGYSRDGDLINVRSAHDWLVSLLKRRGIDWDRSARARR